ncbi:MAG: hypothetical protein HQL23_08375 [Candidatus Omnitrophica bacterium]|nr:hypothetical protein [Candidatus Omnitrophota bacterium]
MSLRFSTLIISIFLTGTAGIFAVPGGFAASGSWDKADQRHFRQTREKIVTAALDLTEQTKPPTWEEADQRHLSQRSQPLFKENGQDETASPPPSWKAADQRHRDTAKEMNAPKFELKDEYSRERTESGLIPRRKHEFYVAPQAASYKYEEPNVMHVNGPSFGYTANYTYRPAPKDFLFSKEINTYRIDGQANWMNLKYASVDGVRNEDEKDRMFEIRGLCGKEFYDKNIRILLYGGAGYRNLIDNNGGKLLPTPVPNTFVFTYYRESNYYYAPLGAEFEFPFKNNLSVTFKGEYDFFIYGQQFSHLSDGNQFNPQNKSSEDTVNNQHHGFGLKSSVEIAKNFENLSIFAAPYIDLWRIPDSDPSNTISLGVAATGKEPRNKTTAFGVRAGLKF